MGGAWLPHAEMAKEVVLKLSYYINTGINSAWLLTTAGW